MNEALIAAAKEIIAREEEILKNAQRLNSEAFERLKEATRLHAAADKEYKRRLSATKFALMCATFNVVISILYLWRIWK